MANPEHLKILKQGVEVWNRWRDGNPEITPELSGAGLRNAYLEEARLQSAVLRGVDLRRANLIKGILDNADLRDAQLQDANLVGAKLRNASLRGAKLDGAVFQNSLLEGADLSYSKLGWTSFGAVDLSGIKGLASTTHRGASSIGADTFALTAAGLSEGASQQTQQTVIENFYRAAGLEEELIVYLRSQIGLPIQFFSCFISYSHLNRALARRLYDHLQMRGIRCWLDEHDLKPGDRILDVVNDAIRLHDKILLCCSEGSLTSWWVKDEIRKAMERERVEGRDIIIPLMVDRYLLDGWEDGLAADLRSRLAADFTGWEHDNAKFEEQFERVVKALRTDDTAREKVQAPKL